MESLGNKLKNSREEKGYTLDFVSQETNISSRYLDALEKEEFSVFPGEPYLLGFLRNYGAYLDLNINELLSLYRSFKIQEQPVPVEALLKSPSKAPAILGRLAIVVLVLGLLGGGVFFFLNMVKTDGNEEAAAIRIPQEYYMNTASLERRFYPGDSLLVPVGQDTYKIGLTALGDTVAISTPTGLVRLDLGQEASVDLGNDRITKLLISVADFSKNDSNAGALIHFDLQLPFTAETTLISDEEFSFETQSPVVLLTSPNPYPFTLQAVFQGYCLFRWEILFEPARAGRNEQYFQQSNELSIQAQNGIRIGLSNAQAVRLQVIGGGRTVAFEAGGPGEVVVADLRWLRDEQSGYRLVLSRLE